MSDRHRDPYPYENVKNVREGLGRIIWGDATRDRDGCPYTPGWVLPGGERTLDERRAHEVALYIDSVTPRKSEAAAHSAAQL